MKKTTLIPLCLVLLIAFPVTAEPKKPSNSRYQRMTWTIDGVTRQAAVAKPATGEKEGGRVPLVFAFHGHGGNMRSAARKFGFHKLWPEAIIVYAQGLPTPGKTDPQGKKPGWQKVPGDQGDRDLKFFDAMLKTMVNDLNADPNRVYVTGHSNGGGFTYLLWSTRHQHLAAVAPSAAGGRGFKTMEPLPAMHFAGKKDPVVKFETQQRVMASARKVNQCNDEPKKLKNGCLLYESEDGAPFVSYIHPGAHGYHDRAAELTVKFFKMHQRKTD